MTREHPLEHRLDRRPEPHGDRLGDQLTSAGRRHPGHQTDLRTEHLMDPRAEHHRAPAVLHRVVVSVDIPLPGDVVWDHVRKPELIRRWYGWDRDDLDEDIERIFVEHAEVEHDHVPGTSIRRLRWHHHEDLELRCRDDNPGHTLVTVHRAGRDLSVSFDGVRDVVDENWISSVEQLRFALTVHPGEERRTLAIHGLDAGPRHDPLMFRAGLHGARGAPIGGHVEATRPDGTKVGGTVVYRTDLQFGVWLHGIAESLLVIQEVPVASHPPHGAINAILTRFGLSDELQAEAERRWAGWWDGTHHPHHHG